MYQFLSLWELLKLIAIADVEVGQSFAITEPFGDCDVSEHKSGYFGAFRAFWKCLHLTATEAKLREGNDFDDNLKSSVVIQVVAVVHFELLQLQLLKAFGHCDASETEQWSIRNDGSCKIQE